MTPSHSRSRDCFSQNLRFLCNRNSSIAQTARALGMNRQQLNKYLNGSSAPSVPTLRRLCTYFNTSESELFLPHDEFLILIGTREEGHRIPKALLDEICALQEQEHQSVRRLAPMCGKYFFSKQASMFDQSVSRSIAVVSQKADVTYFDRVEYYCSVSEPGKTRYRRRSKGIMYLASEKIFVLETQCSDSFNKTLGLSIFHLPQFGLRVNLEGFYLGLENNSDRSLHSAPVSMEFIGRSPVNRRDLHQCGLEDRNIPIENRAGFSPLSRVS